MLVMTLPQALALGVAHPEGGCVVLGEGSDDAEGEPLATELREGDTDAPSEGVAPPLPLPPPVADAQPEGEALLEGEAVGEAQFEARAVTDAERDAPPLSEAKPDALSQADVEALREGDAVLDMQRVAEPLRGGEALLDVLLDAKEVAEGGSEPDTVGEDGRDAVPLPLPPASDDEAREDAEAPLVVVPPPPTLMLMMALAVVSGEMERAGDNVGVPEGEAVPSTTEDDAAGEDEVAPEAESAGVAVGVTEPHALTAAENEDSSTPEPEATNDAEGAPLAVVAAEAEALSVNKAELVEAKEALGLPVAPSEPVAPLLPLGLPVRSGVGVALAVDDGHDDDDGECEGLPEVDGERRGVMDGGGDRDTESVSPAVADLSALPEAPVAVGAPAVALPTEDRVALGSKEEEGCRDGEGVVDSVKGEEALGGVEPVNGSDGDATPEDEPPSLREDIGVPEAKGEPLNRGLTLPLLLGDSVFGDPVTPALPLL